MITRLEPYMYLNKRRLRSFLARWACTERSPALLCWWHHINPCSAILVFPPESLQNPLLQSHQPIQGRLQVKQLKVCKVSSMNPNIGFVQRVCWCFTSDSIDFNGNPAIVKYSTGSRPHCSQCWSRIKIIFIGCMRVFAISQPPWDFTP